MKMEAIMSENNRRNFLKSVVAAGAAGVASGCNSTANTSTTAPLKSQGKSVMGLVVPKMDVVRVGFIGVGQRGSGHVKHYCHIEGVEIITICDTDTEALARSIEFVEKSGFKTPASYSGSQNAYREMLARQDIDIVIISTPWLLHTPMCVETMESGKHAFVEVPAATTIEEC